MGSEAKRSRFARCRAIRGACARRRCADSGIGVRPAGPFQRIRVVMRGSVLHGFATCRVQPLMVHVHASRPLIAAAIVSSRSKTGRPAGGRGQKASDRGVVLGGILQSYQYVDFGRGQIADNIMLADNAERSSPLAEAGLTPNSLGLSSLRDSHLVSIGPTNPTRRRRKGFALRQRR